jgi:acyl transferase domain-containing protein
MFPGVGEHYPSMGRGLFEEEPTFRKQVTECNQLLWDEFGIDIIQFLYSRNGAEEKDGNATGIDFAAMVERTESTSLADDANNQTAVIQPAVFVVEYALAAVMQKWGIYPCALIGYSLGEYVAACIAGVMSWQDALRVVARRANLVQNLPRGAMLAVGLSEDEVRPYLSVDVCLAGINGPFACILSGTIEAIVDASELLARKGCAFRWLRTSHAFHSRMLHPVADKLTQLLSGVRLKGPEIPYVSNLTGDWVTAKQTCDPCYWAQHMCEPVRFYSGLQILVNNRACILLEVGPGNSLSALAKQYSNQVGRGDSLFICQTLRAKYDYQDDMQFLGRTVERIRATGVSRDAALIRPAGQDNAFPVQSLPPRSLPND